MKNCELCKLAARTYCDSDQASLCWDCDAKVHGANFLVARHSRTLLCHACQSQTPWKASGHKLGNTVSVCETCAGGMKINGADGEESEGGNDDEIDTEDDLDDDDDSIIGDDEDDEVGGDEDGDNQVVPWAATPPQPQQPPPPPPPPAVSSSSSEESVSRCSNSQRDKISETLTRISLKRKRENASDLNFQNYSYSQRICGKELTDLGECLACDGEAAPVEGGDRRPPPSHSATGSTDGPLSSCRDD